MEYDYYFCTQTLKRIRFLLRYPNAKQLDMSLKRKFRATLPSIAGKPF